MSHTGTDPHTYQTHIITQKKEKKGERRQEQNQIIQPPEHRCQRRWRGNDFFTRLGCVTKPTFNFWEPPDLGAKHNTYIILRCYQKRRKFTTKNTILSLLTCFLFKGRIGLTSLRLTIAILILHSSKTHSKSRCPRNAPGGR